VDFHTRKSLAGVIAGLMIVNPVVADVDGKPVRNSVLSEDLTARHERESKIERLQSHGSILPLEGVFSAVNGF
jgi:hypothetical protein